MTMHHRRRSHAGFTLLEVMVAILLAMIGLMGTVAIQQTMLNGSTNVQEASIASRLAMKRLEEMNARLTRVGTACAVGNGEIDQLGAYITSFGATFDDLQNPHVVSPLYANQFGRQQATYAPLTGFRFKVETRVCVETSTGCTATATAGAPYLISVKVSYGLDTGTQKEVRMDVERRKCW